MSRWCLVTGGSRGIGRATALELADRGWSLVVAYLRNDEAAGEVAAAIRERGGEALLHTGNLGSREECQRLIRRVEAEVGGLDGLVHCAALGTLGPALDTRPNHWRLTWDTHVGALLDLVALARPLFRPGASIVALTSLGARRVTAGYASLGAVKGALESLVRYLAAELAEADVNFNAVCGGPVDTDSLQSFPSYNQLVAESQRRPPGRIGRPEDLAPIIAFLLDPASRWIRGQTIVADGGFSLY